jgi:L-ascorbate metabolism protein UlaG (beta-lactamase superfamily)
MLMRVPAALLAILAAIPVFAADTLSTSAGAVAITPVKHGTVLLEIAGKSWYVDPWSQADLSNLPKADVILITDVHGDHMDPAAIAVVRKPSTVIVAPKAVAGTVTEAKTLSNGESMTVEGVKVEAIPMYNLKRGPEEGKLFHDKGRGNGYVLNIGGKRIYFSGDTEAVAEMRALKNIDLAFVCMNLPYTMPPDEAAAGVKEFQPKVVYPYHYRGSDLSVFESALKGEPIEVRLREWYP